MSESPDQQPCALVLESIDFEWFGMDAGLFDEFVQHEPFQQNN